MSTQQVGRLQSLLSRVQENRGKPRVCASRAEEPTNFGTFPGVGSNGAQQYAVMASTQDVIETSPPPMMSQPMSQPLAQQPVMRGPARGPAVASAASSGAPTSREPFAESLNAPEHVTAKMTRGSMPSNEPRPMPARPQGSAGATPLEMALEGEVARAAAQTAPVPSEPFAPAMPQGRVLADPAPPTVTRAIAQAVTKHPPTTGHTFGEVLRRSLALRPR